jgi:hypothetical protein
MTRYRLAEQARHDFDEVWHYSAEDNTRRSSPLSYIIVIFVILALGVLGAPLT